MDQFEKAVVEAAVAFHKNWKQSPRNDADGNLLKAVNNYLNYLANHKPAEIEPIEEDYGNNRLKDFFFKVPEAVIVGTINELVRAVNELRKK